MSFKTKLGFKMFLTVASFQQDEIQLKQMKSLPCSEKTSVTEWGKPVWQV